MGGVFFNTVACTMRGKSEKWIYPRPHCTTQLSAGQHLATWQPLQEIRWLYWL